MAIPQHYIEEVCRRTDITELVRGYVELKRAGRMEKGLCPFHNEKTPSFYVYPETSSFYCFGCGAAGDAITFVRRIANLDYVEAVKLLAARAGMPMPDEDDGAAKLRSRLLMANREAARFFVACLNADEGREARATLRRRHLSDGTIRRFGLGYAPDEFGRLLAHLKALGFDEKELTAAGLCKTGQKGGLYDAFRDRLMFPILDLRGNVIAFGGRQLSERGPKYLNSSDTPVFKKSRNLYAMNLARKSASKRMVLAEGYMDVISLHQAGFDTAVATLGTAIGDEQAKLLADYADEVVICYDGDEAGQRATARAIGILEKTPLKVRVLTLAEAVRPGEAKAKDPDEFIRLHGRERFDQLLEGSGNTIEYALHKARQAQDVATPDGLAAYIRHALDVLAQQAMPAEQDIYAGRLAEETGVAKAALLAQLEGVVRQRRRQFARERERRMKDEGLAAGISIPYSAGGDKALGTVFAEQQLLAAVLKNPDDYLPLARDKLRPQQLIAPEMAEAYALALEKAERGEYISLATLSGDLPEKTVALLGKVLALNHDIGFSQNDVEMFIGKILDAGAEKLDVAAMSGEELKRHMEELRRRKGGNE